jgi:hypothetical protein
MVQPRFDRYNDGTLDRLRSRVVDLAASKVLTPLNIDTTGFDSVPAAETTLEDFDVVAEFGDPNWVSRSLDAVNTRCGLTSLKLTVNNTDTNNHAGNVTKDYTAFSLANKRLCFRYYIDPLLAAKWEDKTIMTSATNLYLYFYPDRVGAPTHFASITLPQGAGWHTVEWTTGYMTLNGGMVNSEFATCDRIIFYFSAPKNTVAADANYITFDMLEISPTGATKGGVIFSFDDGKATSYTVGIKYLARYGFRSMWYIAPEMIGTGGEFATWDQVKEAQDAGAIICGHQLANGPVTSISALRDFYRRQKDMLLDHGFAEGADYWAIPGGNNAWTGGYLTRQQFYDTSKEFFVNVRGTKCFWQQNYDVDKWNHPGNDGPISRSPRDPFWSHGANPSPTWLISAKAMVDKVVAANSLDVQMFYTHGLPQEISVADYKLLVEYVKDKIDASSPLEVITLKDIVLGR